MASLSRNASLPVANSMQQTSILFFQNMFRLLESLIDVDDMSSIAVLFFAPFEAEVQRYAVREKERLMLVVEGLSSNSAAREAKSEADSLVFEISNSITVVFEAIEVALQQCTEFTGTLEGSFPDSLQQVQ